MKILSNRDRWLRQVGLVVDPFIAPVAEQEVDMLGPDEIDEVRNAQLARMHFKPEQDGRLPPPVSEENTPRDIPFFYNYFTSPPLYGPQGNIIRFETLRTGQHFIIFGDPGTGKTTLKLNLDAHIRTHLDGTLAVNYDLGDEPGSALTLADHEQRLARNLAIDLVLQTLEQLPAEGPALTGEQIKILCGQVRLGGIALRRTLEAMRKFNPANADEMRAGISRFWRKVNRRAVRYMAPSEALFALVDKLLAGMHSSAVEKGSFWDGVLAARGLGFQRILVMVDAADANNRNLSAIGALVTPLFKLFEDGSKQSVFFRLFLTSDLRPEIERGLKRMSLPDLYTSIQNATINWNEDALQQLLARRFRAAGSPVIHSLDVLAGPDLERGLEGPVLEKAGASPRKLLKIVSLLIGSHARRAPYEEWITRADWEDTLQNLSKSS